MIRFMLRAVGKALVLTGVLGLFLDPTNPAGGLLLVTSIPFFIAGYEQAP
jgi:hypothetical protein